MVNGQATETFNELVQEPRYNQENQSVYTLAVKSDAYIEKMAELAIENETFASLLEQKDTAAINAYLVKNSIEVPYPMLLLKNTEVVLQANAIEMFEMKKTGPICLVTDTKGKYVHHSGVNGPMIDVFHKAEWGETLATSRYVYESVAPESKGFYLASTSQLLGPFDGGTLRQKIVQDKESFLFVGRYNHEDRLFLDEKQILSASTFLEMKEYNSTLYYSVNDYNHGIEKLNGTDYDSINPWGSSNVMTEKGELQLLLRRDNEKLGFQFASQEAENSDLLWALYSEVGEENVLWSWLSGDIDYSNATLEISEKSLTVNKSTEPVVFKSIMTP